MFYQTHEIPSDFRVKVIHSGDEIILSDTDQMLVNEIWEEAKHLRMGNLFNGKLLNFLSFQPEENYVSGEFVEYKYYMAQLKNEYLKSILNIHPISISCLCSCKEFYLLGKRGLYVTDYPGCYEFVPSGGIDPINVHQGHVDLIGQLKMELMEETGLSEEMIENCSPMAFVQDSATGIYEICLSIELKSKARRDFLARSKEYDQLEWISRQKMTSLVSNYKSTFVPFSLFLFKNYLMHQG